VAVLRHTRPETHTLAVHMLAAYRDPRPWLRRAWHDNNQASFDRQITTNCLTSHRVRAFAWQEVGQSFDWSCGPANSDPLSVGSHLPADVLRPSLVGLHLCRLRCARAGASASTGFLRAARRRSCPAG